MPYRTANPIPDLKRSVGAELARRLEGQRAWDVAPSLGIDQPRLANLRNQKLHRFSLESLITYMCRLGFEVELRFVRPNPQTRGSRETFAVRFSPRRIKSGPRL